MITFETIRMIQRQEKNSDHLNKLPDNFIEDLKDYLENKKKINKREYNKILIIIEKIFEYRLKKMIALSFLSIKGLSNPNNLLSEEKILFNNIIKNIKEFEKAFMDKEIKKTDMKSILFLKDIEAFVGIDLKNYGPFISGDISTIPEENYEILLKKGVIREI